MFAIETDRSSPIAFGWRRAQRGAVVHFIYSPYGAGDLNMSILRSLPPAAVGQLAVAEAWYLAYRELGLPALLDSPHLIVRTGASLAAVDMPAELGERVLSQLRQHMTCGPVLRAGERWAFLAEPGFGSRAAAYAGLERMGARLHPHWTRIPLPVGLADENHCWVAEPTGSKLPELRTITAVMRRLEQARPIHTLRQVVR